MASESQVSVQFNLEKDDCDDEFLEDLLLFTVKDCGKFVYKSNVNVFFVKYVLFHLRNGQY